MITQPASLLRLDIQTGHPALQAGPGRRVASEDGGIMTGDDVVD
jgi:hypothetical protein